MNVLRTAVVVGLLALLVAWALVRSGPGPISMSASVTDISVPAVGYVNHPAVISGTLTVRAAALVHWRFDACPVPAGDCVVFRRRGIEGPVVWSGEIGAFVPEKAGLYRVEWTVYHPWTVDSTRAAMRGSEEMVVLERHE